MPSSEYTNEPGIDPLAPLEQLGHWLLTTILHVALGSAIGLVLASEMRRRSLRWTWAAGLLVPVVLAWPLFGGYTLTVGSASLCAMVRGRRWHREDLQSGADLAEIAARRRGPLHAMRSLMCKVTPIPGVLSSMAHPDDDRLVVGADERGGPVSIPFGVSRDGKHALVVGATGSGKTVTATWIATRAIARGMGVVAIDPKGDGHLAAELARFAHTHERRLLRWTPEGPSVYNPYAHGGPSEIADKALAGERFTEPHYMRLAQRYLGCETRVLHEVGLEASLTTVVEYLDPARLEMLARSLPEVSARRTHEYLDSLTARQQSDLSGVRDRLSIMAESDFARWLDPDTPGVNTFDLLGAVRERAVVYFDLQADSRPLLAQMLGVSILIDLQTTASALQRRPTPTLVLVDEFSALAAEQVTRLFGRARSAGLSLLLCTQELSDMRLPGRETVLEQVLGNLSTLIAHRQIVPDSAEFVSALTGSRGVWKTSRSSDGRWTRTRTSAPLLSAELVRGLPDGCAAVVDLGGHPVVSVARMLSTTTTPTTGPTLATRLRGLVSLSKRQRRTA
jgi:hypothetical protein